MTQTKDKLITTESLKYVHDKLLNDVSSNKVSISLDAEYTNSTVELITKVGNMSDTFVCMPYQIDCLRTRDGYSYPTEYARISYMLPSNIYKTRGNNKFVLYIKTSNQVEILDIDNYTNRVVGQGGNSIFLNYAGNVNINQTIDTPFKMIRPAIELYDDNNNLTRVIYGAQINYKLLSTDPYEIEITVNKEFIHDKDTVWYGEMCNGFKHRLLNDDYSLLKQLSNSAIKSDDAIKYIVQYSELAGDSVLFPVLYKGDNIITGDSILVSIPDTTVKTDIKAGETFMLDGFWYKALTNLSIGDTLSIGTNCEAADFTIPTHSIQEIVVSDTAPTITGVANTRYKCGEVTSISITPPQTGSIDVIFSSGSTAATLTLPNTVIMPAWFDSTQLQTNTAYEINIKDGVYGVVMSWAI